MYRYSLLYFARQVRLPGKTNEVVWSVDLRTPRFLEILREEGTDVFILRDTRGVYADVHVPITNVVYAMVADASTPEPKTDGRVEALKKARAALAAKRGGENA